VIPQPLDVGLLRGPGTGDRRINVGGDLGTEDLRGDRVEDRLEVGHRVDVAFAASSGAVAK
jgi:hypothetical protein